MKVVYCIIVSCLSFSISSAQDLSWIRHSEGYLVPLFMEKSEDNRIFISGFVYQNSVYDQTTISTNGLDDVFIGEIAENGDLLWQSSFGSELFDDRPTKLIVDDQNDRLLISGIFGEGGSIGTNICNLEKQNGFIAAFDFDGHPLHARFLGGSEFDGIDDATIDLDGNITLIGNIFGEVDIANTTIGFPFESNSYIVRLDKDMNILWVQDFDGFLQEAHIKQIDPNKTIIAGSYNTDIAYDTIIEYQSMLNEENIMIFAFDDLGNPLWNKAMKGKGRNFIQNLEIYNNQILLIGACSQYESIEIEGTVLPQSNNFILTLEKDGSLSSIDNFAQGFFNNNDVHITKENEILLTGSYTFEASINGNALPTQFSQESYVLLMNIDGQIEWHKTFNGNLNDISVASVEDEQNNIIVLTYYGAEMMVEDTTIFSPGFNLNLSLCSFSNTILSSTSTTAFEHKHYNVYTNGSIITINSDPYWEQSQFSLFSNLGQLIYQTKINSTSQEIITDIPAGSYHYLIRHPDDHSSSGSLIISR